jgi:hypothetical protein
VELLRLGKMFVEIKEIYAREVLRIRKIPGLVRKHIFFTQPQPDFYTVSMIG